MSAVVELWERESNGELALRVPGSPTALSVLPADDPGGDDFERHAEAVVEAVAAGREWPEGSGLPLLPANAGELEPDGFRRVAFYSRVAETVIEEGVSPGALRPATREYLGLSSAGLARVLAYDGYGTVRSNRVQVGGVWCELDEAASVRLGEVMGVSAKAQKLLPCSWLVYSVPDADWIGAWYDGRVWRTAERGDVKEAVQRPRMAERRSRQQAEEAFRAAWATGFYAGTSEEVRGGYEQVWVDGWQAARGFSS